MEKTKESIIDERIPPSVTFNSVGAKCHVGDPKTSLKKIFPIDISPRDMMMLVGDKMKKNKRQEKTVLSLKEKRRLGLYKLRRRDMKYKDFLPLHNLWKEYFVDSIDFLSLKSFVGDDFNKKMLEVQRKLLKIDYHGAILSVKRSCCCSLVGKKGILVFDTKNTFQLLTEENVLRIIPKKNSEFTFTMDNFTFTILGNYLLLKPAARMTKKLKSIVNVL